MKLFSNLMKARESLLIRDPFIFKRLIHSLTDKKSRTVFHLVEDTGIMQISVSSPVSVWLNRYVFVRLSFPISRSCLWHAAHAYAVVGQYGNYRFIPFIYTDEKDNILDLQAYKPNLIQHYLESSHNLTDILKPFIK